MDPTIGLFLVIGFPLVLYRHLAFGRASIKPE